MADRIHYRAISANHLSKSIIFSQNNLPPTWMDTDQFQSNSWPTPAMRNYESIISCDFTQYYWRQDTTRREVMLNSAAREMHHECDGNIYKWLPTNADYLHKQTVEEFKQIIKTKLVTQRNQTEDVWNPNSYATLFGSFIEGERVLLSSPSGRCFEGWFQFISVVNSNYCYVTMESRDHIVQWDINFVERLDQIEVTNRSITLQMAGRQRTGTNEQDAIFLSDTEATSENRSDGAEHDNALNQNGMGVARARNDNDSNLSSSSDSEDYNYMDIPLDVQRLRARLGIQDPPETPTLLGVARTENDNDSNSSSFSYTDNAANSSFKTSSIASFVLFS